MATKKTTSKKAPVKKKSTVKVVKAKKTAKTTGVGAHVGLRAEEQSFMTFRVTKQTLYWLVLGLVVILFTVWIMKLQADVQSIYDQIDANTQTMDL